MEKFPSVSQEETEVLGKGFGCRTGNIKQLREAIWIIKGWAIDRKITNDISFGYENNIIELFKEEKNKKDHLEQIN